MNDIPEAEARTLLAKPLKCEDSPSWEPLRIQPDTFQIGVGVLDEFGIRTGLYVQLNFHRGLKTKSVTYQFSVFKRQPYGLERVYQLEVVQWSRPIKDAHKQSHEHFGDKRTPGDASWDNWQYDDVIKHFCSRTNIQFQPALMHPEHFQLRGQK